MHALESCTRKILVMARLSRRGWRQKKKRRLRHVVLSIAAYVIGGVAWFSIRLRCIRCMEKSVRVTIRVVCGIIFNNGCAIWIIECHRAAVENSAAVACCITGDGASPFMFTVLNV